MKKFFSAISLITATFLHPLAFAQTPPISDEELAEEARERNEPRFVLDQEAFNSATMSFAEGGAWSSVIPWPHVAASAAQLPDGRLLTWASSSARDWNSPGNNGVAATWDPSTNEFTSQENPNHNMFCAHQSMLPDGRVLVNGGKVLNATSIFDYQTDSWERVENMNRNRWYPTTTTLPSGQVFTALGSGGGGQYPEVWSENEGWALKYGINLQDPILSYTGYGQQDWWPLINVAPNGELFHSGPTPQMHYIDPNANGSIRAVGQPNDDWYHKHGTTIMYDEGKLLVAGGWQSGDNQRASNRVMTIDINSGSPVVENVSPMRYARKFHNGVILPTGEVMVVGGNESGYVFSDFESQLIPEIWNPETRQWRSINPISVPRNYHSVALLLPDGRVISAGGGLCNCNADHPDAQLLIPHYLFDGNGNLAARPSITNAPSLAEVGEVISITTTTEIAKFSMIKLSSTTHGNNTDLRYLAPEFVENTTGQYQVYLHENENVLTPGFWMIFALDANDVPSVAHTIQVSAEVEPLIAPTPVPETALDNTTCLREGELRSRDASSNASFDITNNLDTSIQLFWLDYSGNRAAYQVIRPGETLTRTSFAGHPWVVADEATGQCLYLVNNAATVGDITVNPQPNRAPNLVTLSDQTNTVGDTVSLPVTARDEDGDSLLFNVSGQPTGVTFSQSGSFFTGMPSASGAYTVNISVSDGNGGVDQGSFLWTITDRVEPITPPTSILDQTTCLREGQVRSSSSSSGASFDVVNNLDTNIQLFWLDYNGNRLPYQVIEPGQSLTRTSFATHPWIIANEQSGDCLYLIEDSADESVIEVNPQEPQTSPLRLSFENTLTNSINDDVTLNVGTNGSFNEPLHFALKGLPAGLRFDHTTRTITGRIEAAGNYQVIINAEDSAGNNDQLLVGWQVNDLTNEEPVLPQPAPDNARVLACSRETELRSGGGSTVSFNLINNTGRDLQLYWLNFSGERIAYNRIESGATLNNRQSYTEHPWVVADSSTGECLELIEAPRNGVTYTVTGPTPEPMQVMPTENRPQVSGQPITLSVEVNGGVAPYEYRWLFGDNTPETSYSSSNRIQHVYQQAGRYFGIVTVRDQRGEEISEPIYQAIHTPITANQAQRSSTIVIASNRIWAVNADNNSVSVFNLADNRLLAEIEVGLKPRSIALAPNDQLWVVNQDSDSISIIDATNLNIARTINLQRGAKPFAVVMNSNTNEAFISLENPKAIIKLNGNNDDNLGRIDLALAPRHLSLSADGLSLYAPAYISARVNGESSLRVDTQASGGDVFVIDTNNMRLNATTKLALDLASDSEARARGIPNYIAAPAISPDGRFAWLPSKEDNIFRGSARDGNRLNFEHTVRGTSSLLDLVSNQELRSARLDHDDSSLASAATYDNYGNFVFVALETSREIAVVDAYSRLEIFRFTTGLAPQGLVVSNDGLSLYVHNFMDRTIQQFDLRDLIILGKEQVNHTATMITVMNDTLSNQILSGKQFFYDARDTRLAAMNYMSCASCHEDGGHDGRVWDLSQFNEGLRNTISLRGHGGEAHGPLHWSANFNEVHDFENQIRSLAGGTGLMSTADFNNTEAPLGTDKAGISPELDALAAYVDSLRSFGASPYRNEDGSLTASGQQGRDIFIRENCASCHSGVAFTDSASLRTHNVGTIKSSSGNNIEGLDTPTLRGLWETAPYLHDGSALNIREAVQAHTNVNFHTDELDLLVDYLNQIDANETQAPTAP